MRIFERKKNHIMFNTKDLENVKKIDLKKMILYQFKLVLKKLINTE